MKYPSLLVSVTGMSILDLTSSHIHMGSYGAWLEVLVGISEEMGLILGLETRDSERGLAQPLSNALKYVMKEPFRVLHSHCCEKLSPYGMSAFSSGDVSVRCCRSDDFWVLAFWCLRHTSLFLSSSRFAILLITLVSPPFRELCNGSVAHKLKKGTTNSGKN